MLLLIRYHLETAIKRKIVIRSLYKRQKEKKPIVIEPSDFMMASQRELDICLAQLNLIILQIREANRALQDGVRKRERNSKTM